MMRPMRPAVLVLATVAALALVAASEPSPPAYQCAAISLSAGLSPASAVAAWKVEIPGGWEPVGGGGLPASVVVCRTKP